ncbi:MAG TPA: type II toxin-antitoxin system VapC family toxin [Trebonia sp.]|nr:type II toxin-antitoxin system VapC family toxin [Trebonia sp.]
MLLLDTNVLINAHRPEAERHVEYRDWLEDLLNGPQPYAVSDFAVLGMVRVVTNPKVYAKPTPIARALEFAAQIRNQPQAMVVAPGPAFWTIFTELCLRVDARGNAVPDAYLAALAVENACEFVTDDQEFRKFPELRWRRPLN